MLAIGVDRVFSHALSATFVYARKFVDTFSSFGVEKSAHGFLPSLSRKENTEPFSSVFEQLMDQIEQYIYLSAKTRIG
jgi:hypothetical protein